MPAQSRIITPHHHPHAAKMLATPLSRLNISCLCAECKSFLRPLPKNPSPTHFPLDLLPSTIGLGFSLPPTPAATPVPTRKCTPHATPRLRPTAPTLAPSPAFLLSKHNSLKEDSKDNSIGPLALPSLSLSPTSSRRVLFASRAVWANTSSPIDELKTPLTAKTPGLATCAQEQCAGKLVPGFGRAVCRPCEEELRGAVLGLATLLEDEAIAKRERTNSSENDGLTALGLERGNKGAREKFPEPDLFAVPTTPLSTELLLAHEMQSMPRQGSEEVEHVLYALPNTFLDQTYEEFTPTSTYAIDFPALPANCKVSKRSSREVSELARFMSKNGRDDEGKTASQVRSKRTVGA